MFFLPGECRELIRELLRADQIVTFNGIQFDFLVLQRHGGLSKRHLQSLQGKHVDLLDIVHQRTGRRYKLDQLTRANLGEGKKVHGRKMACLDLAELKEANRSDLLQTCKLWKLEQRGKLICPAGPVRDDYEVVGGPHSHLPLRDLGIYVDLDTKDMTEGQMAEYLAGTWGITAGGEFVEF
jgi:hypothetical protein